MLRYRPVNDLIMSVSLQTMTHPVTIIQGYAPSAEAEEDVCQQQFLHKFAELGQHGAQE